MTTVETTARSGGTPAGETWQGGRPARQSRHADATDYTDAPLSQEFLTDRRVIEWSRWKWYPILFGTS